jgi:hypothetical protein
MAKSKKTSKKSRPRKAAKKSKSRKKSSTSKSRKAPRKSKSAQTKPIPKLTNAVRLTFSYDGDNVKLISQERTEMTVPPSDPLKGDGKYKGFWAELMNGRDKAVYRQVMHNPTRNDAEVFPDTPGQSISREPAPKRKGVFVVVVPDTEKGEEVRLCRSSPQTAGPEGGLRALASQPATEITRVKLKK